MTYTIGQYIQSIAMVMIFTTFVNLIMPKGDFQKYIKIVLGLIVILTILAPVNAIIFKNRPSYTDYLNKYETKIEESGVKSGHGIYLETQNEIVLDHLRDKLKPQMIDIIEKSNKVYVIDLDIGFNEDSSADEFGQVTWISMVVEPISKDPDRKKIKIPKIKIGNKSVGEQNKDQLEGEIEKNIKKSLIDFYNLTDLNINITVQKNS